MTGKLPEITTLASESSSKASYDNHPIAKVNHVVRISVMTQPYPWHLHPNPDETFLVIEGRLNIEFEDRTLTHPLENNHFDYRLRVSHRSKLGMIRPLRSVMA